MPFDYRSDLLSTYPGERHAIVLGTDDMEFRHVAGACDAVRAFGQLGFASVHALLPRTVEMGAQGIALVRGENTAYGVRSAAREALAQANPSHALLALYIAGHGHSEGMGPLIRGGGRDIHSPALSHALPEGIDTLLLFPQCSGRELAHEIGTSRCASTTMMTVSDPRRGLANQPTWYREGFVDWFWQTLRRNGGDLYDATDRAAINDRHPADNTPTLARAVKGSITELVEFATYNP